MKQRNEEFWKRKLMAYLHDPPCKPLDFSPQHEEIAWQFCASENMTEDDRAVFNMIKDCDCMASATDRISFAKGKCSNKFNGQSGKTFKHPLSGNEYLVDKLPTSAQAEELLQQAVGGIKVSSENTKWKETFFLYWRRWLEEVCQIQENNNIARHFAYFPAETRLPDHSIWNHMSLTAALQGCRNDEQAIKPAFLSFNLRPVQDFIAQARSTQDLWSGSYMLAWLTAHAMKAVADYNGPDSIIFPSLRGQGIFDLLYRDELYSKIKYGDDSLWQRMYNDGSEAAKIKSAKRLLNPTLPNRFLAVVREDMAEGIAEQAKNAILVELSQIGEKCFAALATVAGDRAENWKIRWDRQLELFPQISWSVTAWEHDITKALEKFEHLPINKKEYAEREHGNLSPHDNLKQVIALSEKSGNDFKQSQGVKGEKMQVIALSEQSGNDPNNAGTVWAANYAIAEYGMSARRNCREFEQFVTDKDQLGSLKDVLSGKEEVIGDEEFWTEQKNLEREAVNKLFKDNEGPYGAINIVKRLWVKNYLLKQLDISPKIFRQVIRFESVPDIAKNNADNSPYVAIIALDGDEMGKWICGAKNPLLIDQIGEKAKDFIGEEALKGIKRPISSAFHLQFSEALANFANHLAGKIVEHYQGQLIYAGGDDVLAMLPADKAIKCARALRAVFRGKKSELPDELNQYDLHIEHDGFIKSGGSYDYMVPGSKADVSCGIAIGHEKYPLQHLIQAARHAEQRAKSDYGRSAFAISLIKRSGEQINWGAKWDWVAIELLDKYVELRKTDIISARFPYALAGLLQPYKLENEKSAAMHKVILQELSHVMDQQGGVSLSELCEQYLANILKLQNSKDELNVKLDDFAKLFLTAAFIERDRGE